MRVKDESWKFYFSCFVEENCTPSLHFWTIPNGTNLKFNIEKANLKEEDGHKSGKKKIAIVVTLYIHSRGRKKIIIILIRRCNISINH